jgi:hypothetical protein
MNEQKKKESFSIMQIKRKKIMCFSFFFFLVQEEESITRAINTWNMDKRWDSRPGIKQQ